MAPPLIQNLKMKHIWCMLALASWYMATEVFMPYSSFQPLVDSTTEKVIPGKSIPAIIAQRNLSAVKIGYYCIIILGCAWTMPFHVPRAVKWALDSFIGFAWISVSHYMEEFNALCVAYCICFHMICLANLYNTAEDLGVFGSLLAVLLEISYRCYVHESPKVSVWVLVIVSGGFQALRHYGEARRANERNPNARVEETQQGMGA